MLSHNDSRPVQNPCCDLCKEPHFQTCFHLPPPLSPFFSSGTSTFPLSYSYLPSFTPTFLLSPYLAPTFLLSPCITAVAMSSKHTATITELKVAFNEATNKTYRKGKFLGKVRKSKEKVSCIVCLTSYGTCSV